jgi:hypothetical protein
VLQIKPNLRTGEGGKNYRPREDLNVFLSRWDILRMGLRRLLCKRVLYLAYTSTVSIFTETANPRS